MGSIISHYVGLSFVSNCGNHAIPRYKPQGQWVGSGFRTSVTMVTIVIMVTIVTMVTMVTMLSLGTRTVG